VAGVAGVAGVAVVSEPGDATRTCAIPHSEKVIDFPVKLCYN
jgi:hypothetical protein